MSHHISLRPFRTLCGGNKNKTKKKNSDDIIKNKKKDSIDNINGSLKSKKSEDLQDNILVINLDLLFHASAHQNINELNVQDDLKNNLIIEKLKKDGFDVWLTKQETEILDQEMLGIYVELRPGARQMLTDLYEDYNIYLVGFGNPLILNLIIYMLNIKNYLTDWFIFNDNTNQISKNALSKVFKFPELAFQRMVIVQTSPISSKDIMDNLYIFKVYDGGIDMGENLPILTTALSSLVILDSWYPIKIKMYLKQEELIKKEKRICDLDHVKKALSYYENNSKYTNIIKRNENYKIYSSQMESEISESKISHSRIIQMDFDINQKDPESNSCLCHLQNSSQLLIAKMNIKIRLKPKKQKGWKKNTKKKKLFLYFF